MFGFSNGLQIPVWAVLFFYITFSSFEGASGTALRQWSPYEMLDSFESHSTDDLINSSDIPHQSSARQEQHGKQDLVSLPSKISRPQPSEYNIFKDLLRNEILATLPLTKDQFKPNHETLEVPKAYRQEFFGPENNQAITSKRSVPRQKIARRATSIYFSCMRQCIGEGRLHPIQCHSLC